MSGHVVGETQVLNWPEFLQVSANETSVLTRLSPDSRSCVLSALSIIESQHFWEGATGEPTSEEWDAIEELIARATREVLISTMIGLILPFVGATLPDGILACDGASHLRVDYPELYAITPANLIEDADHFWTPDLRGRTIIGAGQGVFLPDYPRGEYGGQNMASLSVDQIPPHTHTDVGHVHTIPSHTTSLYVAPGEAPASVLIPLVPSVTGSASANLSNTGGGGAHENMQPFQAWVYGVIAK